MPDEVPPDGETWFLALAVEVLARDGVVGVLSFADPEARATAIGELVFPGHVGTIYQAHNAVYRGRATPRTLHLLPDGTVFSARAAQKVRAREQGWRYAVAQLVESGAEAPAPGEDRSGWLRVWLPLATRRQRHQGNHRYFQGLPRLPVGCCRRRSGIRSEKRGGWCEPVLWGTTRRRRTVPGSSCTHSPSSHPNSNQTAGADGSRARSETTRTEDAQVSMWEGAAEAGRQW
ncbi:hypothetical protein [Myxococcus sp. CA040A]|uniref:hypothetical protein n=1 Tax=Myxococcus sp. CA040A TaxID=2741738 RepID=UPI00157A40EB|nr:hypothetical protein [Myxococcus sp. CA040A]NTX07070.1 hypothetical protein [Myxococcus sp. CA040A]